MQLVSKPHETPSFRLLYENLLSLLLSSDVVLSKQVHYVFQLPSWLFNEAIVVDPPDHVLFFGEFGVDPGCASGTAGDDIGMGSMSDESVSEYNPYSRVSSRKHGDSTSCLLLCLFCLIGIDGAVPPAVVVLAGLFASFTPPFLSDILPSASAPLSRLPLC